MMTHWIIASARPKLPVMSGNAILTAVSIRATETHSPTVSSRNPSRKRVGVGMTASLSDVAPGSMARDQGGRNQRRHNDRPDPRCLQPGAVERAACLVHQTAAQGAGAAMYGERKAGAGIAGRAGHYASADFDLLHRAPWTPGQHR